MGIGCVGMQVGVTPEGVEVPRCSVDPQMQELMRSMPSDSRPLVPVGPDRKWRYMWRIGPRPTKTRFQVRFVCYDLLLSYLFLPQI